MKKIFLLTFIALLSFGTIFAANDSKFVKNNEKNPEKWSDITYENIPILKILEARDGYVVIYQKNKIGAGTVVIPKSWAKGTVESPRKLKFRNIKHPNESFMTIVKKGGEFHHVILTVPMNKQHTVWGLADYHNNLEGTDKTNLDDIKL